MVLGNLSQTVRKEGSSSQLLNLIRFGYPYLYIDNIAGGTPHGGWGRGWGVPHVCGQLRWLPAPACLRLRLHDGPRLHYAHTVRHRASTGAVRASSGALGLGIMRKHADGWWPSQPFAAMNIPKGIFMNLVVISIPSGYK